MSRRRASGLEARRTPETDDGDVDVEMEDVVDERETEDDAEGDPSDETRNMYRLITNLSTYLCTVKEDGEELAGGFQRIPNRRTLPDYFEVISEPVAFSTIRGKIQKKLYQSLPEFVRDVAQICHNAQVYNRPSAPIFGAAVRLREVLQDKLSELATQGKISTGDSSIPHLGDLPPAEETPAPDSDVDQDEDDEEEEEEEEEEEDDEDDEDDSGDEGGRRRKRRGRARTSASARRDREEEEDEDSHKRRGRPPSVLTPTEARIASVLRGLRKFKDEQGNLLILPFERLPDKTLVTDYYQIIANPIALDNIKKKAKRKKYQNVDQALADIDRMFENAKLYNEDDSPLHKAAQDLQQQAHVLAEQEKAKPDDDFRDDDGKLPLTEIDYMGEPWKVGDWVHIRNPNDLAKPIVAQIYRTWQDREGQRWINACWYYRPEQTVHRFDKHFFDHEVVKTGQYRDHQIEDVLDRAFVMFVTRFGRGRPRGLPRDKEVYVCESRYNEEKFRFNKIKTWASCVPDEVRDRDYEMDLFDAPRRLQKLPSPIKHLLREDANESDDLPKPTWGSPNAPPIVGAVHRRQREPNESPPPEPNPPHLPTPVVEASLDHHRRPSMVSAARETSSDIPPRNAPTPFTGSGPSPSPRQYQAQIAAPFPSNALSMTGPPVQQSPHPTHQQPQQNPYPSQGSMRPAHYQQQSFHHSTAQGYPQSPAPPGPPSSIQNPLTPGFGPGGHIARTGLSSSHGSNGAHGNAYNPPRPPEVYTIPDVVNEALLPKVRHNFQCDELGRVLFFTAPPLDRTSGGLSPNSASLGHSADFLTGRHQWLEERTKKRKIRDERIASSDLRKTSSQDLNTPGRINLLTEQASRAMEQWFTNFGNETEEWNRKLGLDGWASPA